MTVLSLTLRAAMFAAQTDELVIALVTIAHETLEEPLRYSSDPTTRLSTDPLLYGTVSRELTFEFLPMTLVLPDDADETAPAMTLILDNVMRSAIPLLRSVDTPALVSVELVLKSAPDVVEAQWPEFDLDASTYDRGQVTLELGFDTMVSEPYPSGMYAPSGFGGLF